MGLCHIDISIFCLETNSLKVEFIRCPSRSARPWRNTSRRLLIKDLSWPSSSPAASSFFFMGKKDRGLQPCIDYRTLNSQMVKLPYLLPLVPAALEELCVVLFFSKLDLHSVYNLVCIWEYNEWKTAFRGSVSTICISSWRSMNLPHCAVPRLHHWSIGNSDGPGEGDSYHGVADSPVNQGTSEIPRICSFLSTLHQGFQLTYCPIDCLCSEENPTPCPGTPMPTKPSKNSRQPSAQLPSFIIQIPMFHLWWKWMPPPTHRVEAMLSQLSGEPPWLHASMPPALRLLLWETDPSGAELWHRESKAACIKLALEEWRHWLEGANPSTHSSPALVTHWNWLYYWLARVRGSHMHPSCSGSLLKGLQTNSPLQITNCPWNRWPGFRPCLQELWDTWIYRLWAVPTMYLPVWKAFFRLLGITMSLFSGYHPQTKAEWKIQELGRYLRAYCQEDQFGWNRFLPWVEYAKNSLRQNTIGLTPFQCMLSCQPPLFPWTGEPSEVPVVDYWFRAMESVWDSAHIHLQWAVRRHKSFTDARHAPTPQYQPGDQVWLSTWDLHLRLPCR